MEATHLGRGRYWDAVPGPTPGVAELFPVPTSCPDCGRPHERERGTSQNDGLAAACGIRICGLQTRDPRGLAEHRVSGGCGRLSNSRRRRPLGRAGQREGTVTLTSSGAVLAESVVRHGFPRLRRDNGQRTWLRPSPGCRPRFGRSTTAAPWGGRTRTAGRPFGELHEFGGGLPNGPISGFVAPGDRPGGSGVEVQCCSGAKLRPGWHGFGA